MNQEIQDNQDGLGTGEIGGAEMKDTAGWIVNVLLKVGASYLANVIIKALGF